MIKDLLESLPAKTLELMRDHLKSQLESNPPNSSMGSEFLTKLGRAKVWMELIHFELHRRGV